MGEELDIYDEFQYIMKYRITKTNREDQKDFINQIKPLLDAEKKVLISCRKFFGEVTREIRICNYAKIKRKKNMICII